MTEAAPKKVLTGEDAAAYEMYLKSKDGSYGLGLTKEDTTWLFRLIVAQFIIWFGMLVFKIWDKASGKSDHLAKDIRESKENWIKVASDIAYMKEHMVTESEVKSLVRDEIKYLRDTRGKV